MLHRSCRGRDCFVSCAYCPVSRRCCCNRQLSLSSTNVCSFKLALLFCIPCLVHNSKIGKERTAGGSGRRRGLLHVDSDSPESIDSADSTTHPDDDSSNTYERDSTDADKETVVELEKAEYAEAAFELPAAIVQAAQVQAEELRQLLAARSPRVQLNKVCTSVHIQLHIDECREQAIPKPAAFPNYRTLIAACIAARSLLQGMDIAYIPNM